MKNLFRALVILCLALVVAPARAGDLSRATELPVGDVYQITNRFFISQIIPESADSMTQVEMRARVNVRAIALTEAGATFRFRVESLAIDYGQLTSTVFNALRFDSEAEDPEFNANSSSLMELIGDPIEFEVAADGSTDTLLAAVRSSFSNDTAGNFLRMYLSERVFSQTLLWIVNLGPGSEDAAVGDSFTNVIMGRVLGEAMVHFQPLFTYDDRDGDLANLSITGSGTVEDQRMVDAKLDGQLPFVPVTISVEGQAGWNVADHLIESLDVRASALLEPEEIDPLGKRIERRRIEIGIVVERVQTSE